MVGWFGIRRRGRHMRTSQVGSGITFKDSQGRALHKVWEEGYAWRLHRGNNENLVRIIDFHTHPAGTERSVADVEALKLSGRPLAIIVHGVNKWSIHGTDVTKKEADQASLRACLPIQ